MKLFEISQTSGVAFGTSGARGLVSAMSPALCGAYAQAFLQAVATDATEVVLGHDLRPSSPAIAAACAQAVRDAGKSVVFVGALPTPAVAYYASLRQSPAIVVTGSHIPFDRNGIKFYRAEGEITKADEAAMLDAEVALAEGWSPAGLPKADGVAEAAYVSRYVSAFGVGALAGKRVVLYEHSSVARDVLRTLLQNMGAEVRSLGRTDTFVPIDTEAVRPEDVAQARAWAQAYEFDAIISTDGDADRPLIGDENGIWLRGDVVGVLCAQILGVDVVVTPVNSNTVVEKCGSFQNVVRTRIGSPYVIAGMETAVQATPAATVVGGYEANGGFLVGTDVQLGKYTLKALPTRDAVLPILALLVASVQRGLPLSKLAASLPARYTASDRIQEVPAEASRALIASLREDLASVSAWLVPDGGHVVHYDETDGLRLTFASGEVVHLRPSGNAPELRCYTEAGTTESAVALCADTLRRVAVKIGKADASP
ncbi:phosphomannomutase [Massilia sp. MS-15]|uniref:phosphomannomutase n=1 Tax=Massilia sp. MS-15 TaxID=2878200 RepID=UPI001CD66352|nr:phosphomannomutase [Massilia sp. MS-15]MCA1248842.1 phosphomannomutase [Massilia sp. MS-15]